MSHIIKACYRLNSAHQGRMAVLFQGSSPSQRNFTSCSQTWLDGLACVKFRSRPTGITSSLTAISGLSRPSNKELNSKSRLLPGIRSGKIPDYGSWRVRARKRGNLRVAQVKRGEQGSLTQGPKSRLQLQHEREEATGLRKGEVLAQGLELHSRSQEG